MRHCVAGYAWECKLNTISIWSLSVERQPGKRQRKLTIQLNDGSIIGECRGYANRSPDAEEAAVVSRWAQDLRLSW
jgi:hypothetical protein